MRLRNPLILVTDHFNTVSVPELNWHDLPSFSALRLYESALFVARTVGLSAGHGLERGHRPRLQF